MAVHLPDDVAAVLEERAAVRGVTVAELISDLVGRSDRRQALEAFIGGAEGPTGKPFDIHRAREEMGKQLSREHDNHSADLVSGQARLAEPPVSPD